MFQLSWPDLVKWLVAFGISALVLYHWKARTTVTYRTLKRRQWPNTVYRLSGMNSSPSFFVFVCALLAALLWAEYSGRAVLGGVIATTLFIWMIFEMWIRRSKRRRSLRKRIEDCDYLVCPICLYSLNGLGLQGNCPECGQSFHQRSLPTVWRELFKYDPLTNIEVKE